MMAHSQDMSIARPAKNACKVCAPLGACLAFRGVRGAVPFLHGSQGCATYIRRYTISHFKEPMDIASSSFDESSTIFGGQPNLMTGLDNVIRQYSPELIGLATTCLAETIGDDVGLFLKEYHAERSDREIPPIIHVSTPAYVGTHAEGYYAAIREIVAGLAREGERENRLALIPGMFTPADLRHLKDIVADFGIEHTLAPDFSDSLDNATWDEYRRIPKGGTSLEEIARLGQASDSIEFGGSYDERRTAGQFLKTRHGVQNRRLFWPIGVNRTDELIAAFEEISGRPAPERYIAERGRLIDAYVDGHKYVFDKRAIVYGEEDLVVGLVSFLAEIGVVPVLAASGGKSGRLMKMIQRVAPEMVDRVSVMEGVDFTDIEEVAQDLEADLMIGSSKGYSMSRKMGIPLLRVGFPIHDRLGGSRILTLGYQGAQRLFDMVANTLIERKQSDSPVGYTYM